MRPLRALSFDLDETLVDGRGLQKSIVQTCEMIASNHAGLNAERLVEANAQIWPTYFRVVEEKWELGALACADLRLEAWRLTLASCGCSDESIAHFALQIHSRLGREAHRLFDDVDEMFARLREERIPCVLVTNGGSTTQREKLRVLALEHWFDVVTISAEVGVRKPDPAAFRPALDKLMLEPRSVWHVGDSLTTDVAGARAAGLTSLWLNRTGRIHSDAEACPDLEIRSLVDLVPFLSERAR